MSKNRPPKVLIVRLSALGDVLQTLPMVDSLRAQWPDVEIGWLVERDAAYFVTNNPGVDYVHISDRKAWLKKLVNPLCWAEVWTAFATLRREVKAQGYDVAVDTQGLLKSAVLLWLLGVPRRVGFAAAREGAPRFYTETVDLPDGFFNPETPIIQHFQDLFRAVGVEAQPQRVPLPVVESLTAQANQESLRELPRPWVVFAPSTQWQSKHWPVAFWQKLLQRLLTETSASVVLVGGKGDVPLSEQILTGVSLAGEFAGRVVNDTGKTSLSQLQTLVNQSDLVVGPDSAPIHLAGASGTCAYVGLYGPTSPKRTPPPMHQSNRGRLVSLAEPLICQPCDASVCPLGTTACMTQLMPDHVFDAVWTVLQGKVQDA